MSTVVFRGDYPTIYRHLLNVSNIDDPEERESYTKEFITPHLSSVNEHLIALKPIIENYLKEEIEKNESQAETYRRVEELGRRENIQSLERNINAIKDFMRHHTEIALVSENELKNIDKTIDELFPEYNKIQELFQWTINRENQATIVSGKIVGTLSNGDEKPLLIHNNPRSALSIISRIDAKTKEEYISYF